MVRRRQVAPQRPALAPVAAAPTAAPTAVPTADLAAKASEGCCVCWESSAEVALLTCCSAVCCHDCLLTWVSTRTNWPEENKMTAPCPRCRSLLDRSVIEKWKDVAVLAVPQGISVRSHVENAVRYVAPSLLEGMLNAATLALTTNPCPKCGRRIYRDGGCENMRCAQPCGEAFKWSNKFLFFGNVLISALIHWGLNSWRSPDAFLCPELYWATMLLGLMAQVMFGGAFFFSEARFSTNWKMNVLVTAVAGYFASAIPRYMWATAETINPLVILWNIAARVIQYPVLAFNGLAYVATSRAGLVLGAISCYLVVALAFRRLRPRSSNAIRKRRY
eukprot:m.45476 g.45476  ORF g.45476 m.45476 type:complete len:333 (+) comp47246_c0_seq2:141-1139(+)